MHLRVGRSWLAAPTALWLVLTGGCASSGTTTVRQHPELDGAVARIERIAILRPEVGELRVTAFGGNELQPERERMLAEQLVRTLRSALQGKSYTVITEPESWPGDEIKPETPETRLLRSTYSTVVRQIHTAAVSPDEARRFRISVGPVATAVAAQRGADALLVVRYSGYQKSGGRKTAEAVSSALLAGMTGIAGGPITGSEGQIELALIDGSNGNLLWSNQLSGRTDRKRGAAASRGYFGPADLTGKAIAQLPARAPPP